MVPLLNEEYLNVVKVASISMGTGVAKAILISLTAISSSCDFLFCTFVFLKSMQWNACAFWMAFCGFKKCNQIDAELWKLFDHFFLKPTNTSTVPLKLLYPYQQLVH